MPSADGGGRPLGADLAVPGPLDPAPLPAPSATAEVDGHTVELTGSLPPGAESQLTLRVSRDGVPVTGLPAPAPGPRAGSRPEVEFRTTAPSAGT